MNRGGGLVTLAGLATATAVLLMAILVGAGWSASAQLIPGPTEVGGGADVGEQAPAYWVWEATQVWEVPAVVPAELSATAGTPTRLPGVGSSFTINAAKAGDPSVRWEFEETTAAPVSTELELRFLDGLSGPAAKVTVYLETQATVRAGALVFYLFWDAGASAPSAITVATMQVDVLGCTAVGTCP